jgi:hypothetical protein
MEIKASGDLGGRGLGYSCSYLSLPGGGGGVVRAAARGTGDAAANAAVAARAIRPLDELAATAGGRGSGSVRGCGEGSGEHRRDHSRRHGVRELGREWVGGLREGISGRNEGKKWKGGAVAAVAVVVVAV